MAKKKEQAQESFFSGKFELVNKGKVERAKAIAGDDEKAILVEYDKLGGFIRYEGNKVVNGAFYDKKTGQAIGDAKPRVIKKQKAIIEEEIEEVELDDEDVETPKAKAKGKKKEVETEEVGE